jgi:glucose/mannose transport system substrate-binding protein
MKPAGDWVAAPMNIPRINWIWGSIKAMEQAGIKALPKTWVEFNADCDKAVAAHLICLAHF